MIIATFLGGDGGVVVTFGTYGRQNCIHEIHLFRKLRFKNKFWKHPCFRQNLRSSTSALEDKWSSCCKKAPSFRFTVCTCHLVQAQFRSSSTHVPNLTDELSTAKERRLNQFGTAVLVWCDKSVKFDIDRQCRTFVELKSDVAPVSLQSRTYSVRFGTWKVRRLNQASLRDRKSVV